MTGRPGHENLWSRGVEASIGRDVEARRRGAPKRLAVVTRALLLCMTWCGAAPAAAGDGIALRGSVRLEADQLEIRLADVADLTGPIAQALGDCVVYETSSTPLRPVTIHVDSVRRRLDSQGANLGMLALSGRECVLRWRASAPPAEPVAGGKPVRQEAPRGLVAAELIGQRTLRGVIADYLARILLRTDPDQVQLTFRDADAEVLNRSTAGFEFEIRPLASALSSTVPLNVNVHKGGAIAATHRVTVEVALRRRVLIVQRYMSRGETLAAGDVTEETRLIEPHPASPLGALAEVVGCEARGRLVPGQVLREGDVLTPVVVARNSEVWLRARHGSFMLRMRARALDEGRAGDAVRVRRISDRAEFVGIVDGGGEVVVNLGY